MSVLSVKGFSREADVSDGTVPLGLILRYSGSKLSAATSNHKQSDYNWYYKIRRLCIGHTEIYLLDIVVVFGEALFGQGEVYYTSPLRADKGIDDELNGIVSTVRSWHSILSNHTLSPMFVS